MYSSLDRSFEVVTLNFLHSYPSYIVIVQNQSEESALGIYCLSKKIRLNSVTPYYALLIMLFPSLIICLTADLFWFGKKKNGLCSPWTKIVTLRRAERMCHRLWRQLNMEAFQTCARASLEYANSLWAIYWGDHLYLGDRSCDMSPSKTKNQPHHFTTSYRKLNYMHLEALFF